MKLNEIETYEDAQTEIEAQLSNSGIYTHNILGMLLRHVDENIGRKEANQLIEEYCLDNYGFNEEPEE